MSLPNNTDPIYNKEIHFDTLLERSLDDIHHYSKDIWSDKGEHDPGVTILQALTWSTADLAFRHTFPIEDLLAPEDESTKIVSDLEGKAELYNDTAFSVIKPARTKTAIFDSTSSPQKLLSCAPVTIEDYRHALMDLTIKADMSENALKADKVEKFCFSHIYIEAIKKGDNLYKYHYDKNTGYLIFGDDDAITNIAPTVTVLGDYQISYVFARGLSIDNKVKALATLHDYLEHNRQLCSNFISSVELEEQTITLLMDVELSDDCIDYSGVLEQVVRAAINIISPDVKRTFSDPNLFTKANNENIQGPRIEHGKIDKIDDINLGSIILDIKPLAKHLKKLHGIKNIKKLEIKEPQPLSNDIKMKFHPNLWEMSNPDINKVQNNIHDSIHFYKKGQFIDLAASVKTVYENIIKSEPVKNSPIDSVPQGMYRDSKNYFPTKEFFPANYGLKQLTLTDSAKNLLFFLYPFESWNFLQQTKMMLLPMALGFTRSIDTITGQNLGALINFNGKLASKIIIDSKTRNEIEKFSKSFFYTVEQELAITHHLLNYFGEQRADRSFVSKEKKSNSEFPPNSFGAMTDSEKEYINVQHAFLRELPDINYARGNINIKGISALQKRIAARLGKGYKFFNNVTPDKKNNLKQVSTEFPFYIVENRKLLPLMPKVEITKNTTNVTKVSTEENNGLNLLVYISSNDQANFEVGLFADMTLVNVKSAPTNTKPVNYNNLLIREKRVGVKDVIIVFKGSDDTRLNNYAQRVKSGLIEKFNLSLTKNFLRNNRNSIVTPLLTGDSIEITSLKTLPAGIQDKAIIDIYEYDPLKDKVSSTGRVKANSENNIVSDFNRLNNTVTLSKAVNLDSTKQYYFELQPNTDNEPFSSSLSIVFEDNWLPEDSDKPQLAQWIQEIVDDEIPFHLTAQTHFLKQSDFNNFKEDYNNWVNENYSIGGSAYTLLHLLSLGQKPSDSYPGIGTMRVVGLEKDPTNSLAKNDYDKIKSYSDAYTEATKKDSSDASKIKARRDQVDALIASDIFFISPDETIKP